MLVPEEGGRAADLVQVLQAFGVLLSVTKMVLFALIINSVGRADCVAQVRCVSRDQ